MHELCLLFWRVNLGKARTGACIKSYYQIRYLSKTAQLFIAKCPSQYMKMCSVWSVWKTWISPAVVIIRRDVGLKNKLPGLQAESRTDHQDPKLTQTILLNLKCCRTDQQKNLLRRKKKIERNYIFKQERESPQKQCAAGNSHLPCFTLTSCVDKQWINNSTAEESLDTAVAILGNIFTATAINLCKNAQCTGLSGLLFLSWVKTQEQILN